MSSGGYTREDFNDEMNDMELALEKEQECQEFYKQSAEEVSEAGVEALYEWFADVGEKRGVVLQTIHTAAQDTDSWAADVLEQTQSADVPFDSAPAFDASTSGKPGQVEIMTLRQAIELEKKSASIYHIAMQPYARTRRDHCGQAALRRVGAYGCFGGMGVEDRHPSPIHLRCRR